MPRKHFHTFDALRFFSFLLVFLHHLPRTNRPCIDFFLQSGGVGVSFFFVLSGFLITYILLHERTYSRGISLKHFFGRRILRIWPLFYAMILFAFLSQYALDLLHIPHEHTGYQPNWLVSIFFAENYRMMLTGTFPDGAPLRVIWSLCIEEHFYLLWGISLWAIPLRKMPHLILSSILLANFTRWLYAHFHIAPLDLFSNLDYFAYGAIPAYMLMEEEKYLGWVERVPLWTKYGVLLGGIAAAFILPHLDAYWQHSFSPFVLGVLFSLTILFTLVRPGIYIGDDCWVSKLGTYTYGLYLYHTIVILMLLQFSRLMGIKPGWLLFAALALVVSIFISMASYHVYEKPFLRLKRTYFPSPSKS
ncbi:MAG: acyltransferase [Bacteroidetes bacterium]|nr:MAG: acyltransferase [Bacteroidota bacterium]